MAWIALCFSRLSLDIFAADGTRPEHPCAIVDSLADGRGRILLCNAPATAAGVHPGLSGAAARAIAADLRLLPRDAAREQQVLEELAAWAMQFSAQVSVVAPDSLLVEVARSRRLFGGERSLLASVREALAAMHYAAVLSLAPTPKAALLLARSSRPRQVRRRRELHAALTDIPLEFLPLAGDRLQALRNSGLRRLGDLYDQPRSALGKRLGSGFLGWWARLLGEEPDTLPLFQPPPQFDVHLELPWAVEDAEGLVFAARRLLVSLEGFLRGRQLAVQHLAWRLSHGDSSVTAFTLGFQQPLRDASRMLELLKQRLERLELPAAACDLGLKAEGLLPWSGGPVPLLTGSSPDADAAFLDRVRARLGADAVTGIGMVADHRPERAMRSCVPGSSPLPLTFPPRPLWLLPRPLPLEVRAGRPWRDGPLSLEGERERIEVGWWDGEPVRRDYFVARAVTGERLWIFLDRRRGPRWFLHGLFG